MSAPGSDACWRTIGIRGDRSCPELAHYIHCFNCPVTARAADALLDREQAEAGAAPEIPADVARALSNGDLAVLVFRIGSERFAIACADAVSVELPRPVARVPHRRGRGFRGLCNVQGQLRPCAALDLVLGIAPDPAADPPARRLLVVGRDAGHWTFEADEVYGTVRVDPGRLVDPPATVARSDSRVTRARFEHEGAWVGLLDAERLFRALAETLS